MSDDRLTPEERAVLDAADAWMADDDPFCTDAATVFSDEALPLMRAIAAWRASRERWFERGGMLWERGAQSDERALVAEGGAR